MKNKVQTITQGNGLKVHSSAMNLTCIAYVTVSINFIPSVPLKRDINGLSKSGLSGDF